MHELLKFIGFMDFCFKWNPHIPLMNVSDLLSYPKGLGLHLIQTKLSLPVSRLIRWSWARLFPT